MAASGGIGAALLRRMGWEEGQGLGKDGKGRTEPVQASNKRSGDMRGLGFQGPPPPKKRPRHDRGRDAGASKCAHTPDAHPCGETADSHVPFSGTRFVTDGSANIRRGMQVRLRGLTRRPELNGSKGFVDTYSPESQRYSVLMDAGSTLSVRVGCLLQLLPRVLARGLVANARLNNEVGGVVDWDEAKQRYLVQLKDSKHGGLVVSLKPVNVALPVETVVTVVGLTSAKGSKWNGKQGLVVAADEAGGTVDVALVGVPGRDGAPLRMSCGHVRV